MAEDLCLLRGGGDLATGVAWRLTRAGFRVVALELERPLTVRRTVALSTAVTDGHIDVEGLVGRRAETYDEAVELASGGVVGVLVSRGLPVGHGASVVVDARLAKRNIDTSVGDADLVIGLGPGFTAGLDCHAVVETLRGPHLGRVIWDGAAAADTSVPGVVGGRGADRVLRASGSGLAEWDVAIGELVARGQVLGRIGVLAVKAPFDGVVRGLIRAGTEVSVGLKVGDVDPRPDTNCHEISDKALAVGGGVVEAVLGSRSGGWGRS